MSAEHLYCYLTTTGRRTGRPHEIEIWFGRTGNTLYLLSGGRDRSDWVRNLQRDPKVTVRLGEETYHAKARVLSSGTEEDTQARRMLVGKYATAEDDLVDWGRRSLVVALDLIDS